MMKTNKRILDQTCFACKKTPSFDDRFTSDNQYACPEMSYIICQSCKDTMVGIQKNPLMLIHSIICLNSVWYCCHYNPHKLKRCSIQVKYYDYISLENYDKIEFLRTLVGCNRRGAQCGHLKCYSAASM